MKSRLITTLAFAGATALLLAGCGSTASGGGEGGGESAAELDHVTVQLDYVPRGNHAMFFVGQEKGFFEEEGIVVDDIIKGTGSPDAMRIVGGGQADFGFGDLPTLVTARSQGVEVTALAAVNQTSPLAMCGLSEKHDLQTAADLKGLNIGVHPAGSTYIFWQALLAANNMTAADVTELTVTPPYESYLLTGNVDAIICYIDAEVPELEAKAGGPGSLSVMLGSENGYDVYGSGMFTSSKLVAEDPDLVERFTRAYIKSFQYVIDNPAEAAEIVAASAPELADKAEVFQEQLQADIDYTFESELTDELGLGAMSEEVWQSTIDVLSKQGVIETAPAVNDVFDSSFVEKAHQ
ncbi:MULTISPECIES: ABC transporter substrate-binding protein [unclassified Leucobacter]|uniref:ABC transporter substrate-binding protein n=1 Tax=unclassified Leucobacter TaxID=2621730 RepID=UPI00165DA6B0|nr:MULTISPECIES: ABC transporter substrate-binding protein [unclassified Leucobacter]MBC9926209.1 ABC transporter substrate-binding protein [Leucobacter sp. cx-169]